MKKQFIDRRKVWHKKKELKEVSGKARIGGGLGEGGLCSLDSTLKKFLFASTSPAEGPRVLPIFLNECYRLVYFEGSHEARSEF